MIAIPCIPPGELCELRGGVLVRTVTPRQRMACGWYRTRNDAARGKRVAHHVVRAVVADHVHVERR